MPTFRRAAVLAAGLLATPALSVTPVEKVVNLLKDMQKEVQDEGKAEATSYDEFACFCQETTGTKAEAITSGKTQIDSFSATIAEDTAQLNSDQTELQERKAKQEGLEADKAAKESECEKDELEYKQSAASLSKALKALKNAIDALEGSKPAAAALVQLKESDSAEVSALATAVSMLQQKVDPLNPEYKFFSQPIINTMTELQKEFGGKKTELDAEWTKTKNNCDESIKDFGTRIGTNSDAMGNLDTSIEGLKGSVSQARQDLVLAQSALKDDKLYLKDLTERCEKRANDWDQRSAMRSDELTALEKALNILMKSVSGLDEEVNKRALLQGNTTGKVAAAVSVAKALSFFQNSGVVSAVGAHDHEQAAAQARAEKVQALLRGEGQRLRSTALVALAFDLKADPFTKVKDMIQNLIERLLAEATGEAKKEHYCREQLATAEKDRDYRLEDAKKLNVALAGLESKKDELETEIDVLAQDIETLNDNLNKSTELRKTEHEQNMDSITKAKEGLAAVTEAIVILKTFYKQAAGAGASMLQASPVDEDTSGPGFEGSYTGKQERSKGVIGMLEVIKSDFQRTVSKTTEAEEQAAADQVKFDRTSKVDLASKEKKSELDQEDLVTTSNEIEQKMEDLKTQMTLVDNALEKLEALQPMCVDNGMSYEERKEKREQEIEALNKALCILDTNGVETKCGGPSPYDDE